MIFIIRVVNVTTKTINIILKTGLRDSKKEIIQLVGRFLFYSVNCLPSHIVVCCNL